MHLWQFILLLLNISVRIKGHTHWIVQENGKIQTKLDTPFRLSRHYDLISLLDQELRHREMAILSEEIKAHTKNIELQTSSMVGSSDIESRVIAQYPECHLPNAMKVENIDFYSYIGVANGSVTGFQFEDWSKDEEVQDKLDCREFVTLNFSMFAYEHLPTIIKSADFKVASARDKPELKNIMPFNTLQQFNNAIKLGLQKNSSSWFHYNWGILYWWMSGDGHMALECARRALYYVPRQYKHIPLLNLGSILHQGRSDAEAFILLHAALDSIDPEGALQLDRDDSCPVVALALAHVYAAQADFNSSATYLDAYLRARPHDERAQAVRLAISCHKRRLEEFGILEAVLDNLQDLLTDMHAFNAKQYALLLLHERSIWEQAPGPDIMSSLNALASHKQILSEKHLLYGAKRPCNHKADGSADVNCDIEEPDLDEKRESLSNLLKIAEEQMQKIERTLSMNGKYRNGNKNDGGKSKEDKKIEREVDITVENFVIEEIPYLPLPSAEEYLAKSIKATPANMPDRLYDKYPVKGAVNEGDGNLYFDVVGWPSIEECNNWSLPLDEVDDLDLPIFMPPENKGFQVPLMLSDYIDLSAKTEHPLPWHPPHCEYTFKDDVTAKLLAAHDQKTKLSQSPPHAKIFQFLRNCSGIEFNREVDIQGYAEIGQRIVTALDKKSGPSYVLKTVASLYWRAKNNAMNALACLNSDLSVVPQAHQDMLFVSIGSLLHHLGYADKAMQYANAAYKVNFAEPSTNFLLALLHYQRNSPILAERHMRNVLRADVAYYDGWAERLLRIWACRVKTGKYKDSDRKEQEKTAVEQRMDSDKHKAIVADQCGVSDKVDKIAELIREKERRVEELKREGVSGVKFDASGLQDCTRREKINTIKRNSKLAEARCSLGKEFCGDTIKSIDSTAIDTLLISMDDNTDSPPEEPDQSQLESLVESVSSSKDPLYFIKVSKDVYAADLGDFYIKASIFDDDTEKTFHIFDKSGSYPLSHKSCKVIQSTDWMQISSLWEPIAKRDFNVGEYLKPLQEHAAALEPVCSSELPESAQSLDHLTSMVLRHRLPNDVPENYLTKWLVRFTGDHDSSVSDIGTKISLALQENGTSWMLATAAAFYWRVVGNTGEAVNCLRQAITYVPDNSKDIPLANLANLLNRAGFQADALEVAYLALNSHPEVVLNHFTAGNIFDSFGNIDNAIMFYRACLNIDANFEPARNRLQAILCTLLFEDTD